MLIFCKWNLAWKLYPFMLFNTSICFCTVSTTHNPTFQGQWSLFVVYSSVSTHIVLHFSFALDILSSERGAFFLTGAKVVKASYSFKNKVATETKPIYSKTITCFLSTCCVEVFKLTVMSRPFKIGHDHILEITGLVVSTTGMALVESFQDTITPIFLVVSISRNKHFNTALLWGAKVSRPATRDGTRWWGSSNPFCCTSVFQAFFPHTIGLEVKNR